MNIFIFKDNNKINMNWPMLFTLKGWDTLNVNISDIETSILDAFNKHAPDNWLQQPFVNLSKHTKNNPHFTYSFPATDAVFTTKSFLLLLTVIDKNDDDLLDRIHYIISHIIFANRMTVLIYISTLKNSHTVSDAPYYTIYPLVRDLYRYIAYMINIMKIVRCLPIRGFNMKERIGITYNTLISQYKKQDGIFANIKYEVADNIKFKTCNACKKNTDNLNMCSACKMVYYCDRICQKSDWKEHKEQCISINKSEKSEKKRNNQHKLQYDIMQTNNLDHISDIYRCKHGQMQEKYSCTICKYVTCSQTCKSEYIKQKKLDCVHI